MSERSELIPCIILLLLLLLCFCMVRPSPAHRHRHYTSVRDIFDWPHENSLGNGCCLHCYSERGQEQQMSDTQRERYIVASLSDSLCSARQGVKE